MVKTIVLLFLFWLGLAGTLPGQPLDSLLALAYRQHPELRMRQLRYEAALERRGQVNALPDPEFGLGVFILPIQTRLGPQRVRMSATQRLPWMGSLQAREDLSAARARDQFLEVELRELDLEFAVREAFYRLYELRETRQVLTRNLAYYQALEDYELSRVENGTGSTAEVLRARLDIQAVEQEIRRLDNQRGQPLARLNEALDRPVETPVDLPDTLAFARVALDRDTLLDYLRTHHPRPRQLEWQQAVAEREIELNNLSAKPEFSVGLDYIVMGKRPDMEVEGSGRDALMVRGSVSLPLFRGRYQAKEREERLRIDALEQEKRQWENQTLSELEQAYVRYRDAELQLAFYQEQLNTLASAINIVAGQYGSDLTGFGDLVQLYIQRSNYELGIVQAVVSSHLARAAIDRLASVN